MDGLRYMLPGLRIYEQGRITLLNLLATLLLTQPRRPLAAFSTRIHCWLKVYLMTTKMPHIFCQTRLQPVGAQPVVVPGAIPAQVQICCTFDLLNFINPVSPHHKSILTTPSHLLIPDTFGNSLQANLPHHLPQQQRCG